MSTSKTAGACLATTGTDPQVPGVAQMVEHLSKALATVAAEAEVTERYLTQDPVPTAAVRRTVRALAAEARHVAEMYRALRLLIERR